MSEIPEDVAPRQADIAARMRSKAAPRRVTFLMTFTDRILRDSGSPTAHFAQVIRAEGSPD